MYSLSGYGDMMADHVRMDAYARALRRAIEPGAIVVDIGTGTGIMAFLACQYGAKRVVAIETADVIEVAREIARANGLDDRIEFIQKSSTETMLRERADVIVSDLRGVLPLFRHHVPAIIDARRRLLVPGGVLIPRRDRLYIAGVSAPHLYARHVAPWDSNQYALDMRAAVRIETNVWRKARARPEDVFLKPQLLATLDYTMIDRLDLTAEVQWSVTQAGVAHGLIVWFDADLGGDIGFSNAPGMPDALYGHAFFPWSHPVGLAGGDTVSVGISATLIGDDYVWCWNTRIANSGTAGRLKAEFRQSAFFGVPLSPASLAKRSAEHIPALNDDGRLDRLILELLDEHVPLGRIANELLSKFPSRLSTWAAAMARVADLSARYSQ